ncbi:MAG: dTDP-4-dehydrorhamnose 3,5-epimerase [Deltaproteobacteria bacterium]|nr:dTDP-4-dehydrorhamnose 3,5-epimerase [Nannocystaceae bacterium]
MKVTRTELAGVLVIEPDVFGDDRGYFLETWSSGRYAEIGVPELFVQDNLSMSRRDILRGLHLQHPFGQGKLVSVAFGEVFDVALDVRLGSPTFGRWVGTTLSGDNHRQVYIPPGFAHGFCVTSDTALFSYKCTEPYHRESELGVAWDDPDVAISWPVAEPQLSGKDSAFPRLRDIPRERLPSFAAGPGQGA